MSEGRPRQLWGAGVQWQEPAAALPHIDILGDKLREGDSCFVKADGDVFNQKPFMARLRRLQPDRDHGGFQCHISWYYRPEDPGLPGGRKPFHGERELYKSDHTDVIHSETILGRCTVHKLEEYTKLDIVRPHDYYTRFSWSVQKKCFSPEEVTIYCSCRTPENPDRRMWGCDGCGEWFHAHCVGSTPALLDATDNWLCPACEQRRGKVAAGAGAVAGHPAAQAPTLGPAAAGPAVAAGPSAFSSAATAPSAGPSAFSAAAAGAGPPAFSAAAAPAAGPSAFSAAAGASGPLAPGGSLGISPALLQPLLPPSSMTSPLTPDTLLEALQAQLAGLQQAQQQQQQAPQAQQQQQLQLGSDLTWATGGGLGGLL